MQRSPLRVVAGAVIRDGRVLAALRGPGMPLAGCWELPGGKVEAAETDEDALVRELVEELGVEVRVGAWLGEVAHDRILLVAYTCTLVRGEPRPVEHAEVRWIGADALDSLGWAPADVPLVAALRAWLLSSA